VYCLPFGTTLLNLATRVDQVVFDMCTRGLKAWRFRKRYYTLYNNKDSYPDHLGMQIVQRIPSDREKYLAWLQAERKKVGGWETFWDRKMAVSRTPRRHGRIWILRGPQHGLPLSTTL